MLFVLDYSWEQFAETHHLSGDFAAGNNHCHRQQNKQNAEGYASVHRFIEKCDTEEYGRDRLECPQYGSGS